MGKPWNGEVQYKVVKAGIGWMDGWMGGSK